MKHKIIINGASGEVQCDGQTIATLTALQGQGGLGLQAESVNRENCTVEYAGRPGQPAREGGGGDATGQGQQVLKD